MSKLQIVADAYIPYLEPLAQIADVKVLAPEDITRDVVADADALLVRTRTRCDEALLGGSRVRFVGTATIGHDHIDLDWCRRAGIVATNAPGCNAPAVAQYVFSSLMHLANRQLRRLTIGIVGVGHVGSIVERWARALHMRVMRCDPPRQRAEGGDDWYTLEQLAERADVITFHTPLTREGEDATYHLADERFFGALRRGPIVINAARGPVADTTAWLEAIQAGVVGKSVVDCWEGEPHIDMRLLELADIATPHIAGYSLEGKQRATYMVVQRLCETFGLPMLDLGFEPAPVPDAISPVEALRGYNPMIDMEALRAYPDDFENLRNNYPLRHELRGRVIF